MKIEIEIFKTQDLGIGIGFNRIDKSISILFLIWLLKINFKKK